MVKKTKSQKKQSRKNAESKTADTLKASDFEDANEVSDVDDEIENPLERETEPRAKRTDAKPRETSISKVPGKQRKYL